MLEFMYNVVAVLGFFFLLTFAFIGFSFVAKALSFAAELQILEYKYEKVKKMKNTEAAIKAAEKLRDGKAE